MAGIVKAECAGEIRRFPLGTDATLETLNAKLCELFPRLKDMQFDIYYKDPDGDAIRIGGDDELTHAWTTCGEETILRIVIQCVTSAGEPRRTTSGHLVHIPMDVWGGFGGMADPFTSTFDSLFQAFDDPFFAHHGRQWWLPWERRQLSLKQREEQLRHQRELEEKLRKEHEEKKRQMDEFFRKEAESFRQQMEKQRADAEEAAKKKGEVEKKTPKGTVVVARPKVHYTPFGSYEPVHRSGPGWSSTSWGPVGYELYYHHPGDGEEEEAPEMEQKTEESQEAPEMEQKSEESQETPQQTTTEKDEKME